MNGDIVNFLLGLVVIVMAGAMAFATFFVAESTKEERRREK